MFALKSTMTMRRSFFTLNGLSRTLLKMKPVLLLVLLASPMMRCSGDKSEGSRSNNNRINRKTFADYEQTDEFSLPSQQTTSTGGCGSCVMREEIKNRNLELIKGEVLSRMGFQTAPNITGRVLPQVPAHFLAMIDQDYDMQSDQPQGKTSYSVSEEVDEYHVRTEKVLTFAQPYPRLRHSWRGHDILHFTFSESITKYHVSNATLYVYIRGTERRPAPDVLVEVFKIYRIPDHTESPGRYRVFSRKISQPVGRGDWVQIELTETVSEWFKNPRENLGFIVNATVNGRKVVVTDTTVDNGSKTPYVDVATMESRRRTRRNVGLECDDYTNQTLCCRYPLMVNFEAFGWDFIIAPKKYDAHYCSGDCPFVTLQKHPHTHLLKMASPNSGQPCCTPRKMSPITMLYFDQDLNVVYGTLPGMVVDRCGCS